MKTIVLLGAALVAGAIRYPVEGPLKVHDEEADRLVENGLAEHVTDDEPESDGLDDQKVEDLKKLAATESVDLGTLTKKDDIIAAIRAHRAKA